MGNGYRAVGLVGRGGEGKRGDQTALGKKISEMEVLV